MADPAHMAVRLLRAKAGELESAVLGAVERHGEPLRPIEALQADVALIAALLADHIERTNDG